MVQNLPGTFAFSNFYVFHSTLMGMASYLHIAFSPETFSHRSCFSSPWLVLLEEVAGMPELVVELLVVVVLLLEEVGGIPDTACLKWKKRFLAGGFPIFLGRWSDQTFFESSNKTKTENICCCWIFVKTKDLSKIFVKNVPSEVWIGYKMQFLKKIWWCLPQGADSFSL